MRAPQEYIPLLNALLLYSKASDVLEGNWTDYSALFWWKHCYSSIMEQTFLWLKWKYLAKCEPLVWKLNSQDLSLVAKDDRSWLVECISSSLPVNE